MDQHMMDLAIEMSRRGTDGNKGGPFGAVVSRKGQVISAAYNRVTGSDDPTAHAEVRALRMAAEQLGTFDLSDCEIYASSEPCPMCFGAIYWSRVQRVYFANTREDAARIGFDDSFIYEELNKELSERSIPFIRVNAPAAQQVFDDWMQKDDKVEY